MRDFSLEYTKLIISVQTRLQKTSIVRRSPLMNKVLPIVVHFALQPVLLTYHEYGHASRAKAFGLDSEYSFFFDESIKTDNFWEYFGYAFTKGFEGGYVNVTGNYYQNIPDNLTGINGSIILAAGGLNNNVQLSETFEEDIYYNGGYRNYFLTYLTNKIQPAIYTAFEYKLPDGKGDPTAVEESYQAKGYDIEKKHFIMLNMISLFGSATFYKFLPGSSGRVTSSEYAGVRLPDTQLFFTHLGLSLKLNSGYALRKKGLFIPLSYERVVIGQPSDEISAGIVKKMSFTTLGAKGYYNLQMNGQSFDLFTSIRFGRAFLTAGLSHYDSNTFFGIRDIPSYEDGGTNNEMWARGSLLF
jgi:hypothetical protein